MIEEILGVLNKNFGSVEKSYKYFLQDSNNEYIFFEDFKKGLNALFPDRFYDKDIRSLYNKIKEDEQDHITFHQFVTAFDTSKKSLLLLPQRPNSSYFLH